MTLQAYMRAFVQFLSLGTLIGPREMAANFLLVEFLVIERRVTNSTCPLSQQVITSDGLSFCHYPIEASKSDPFIILTLTL